jgi:transaldolase / glucose-6-phosphate isomerase
MQRKGLAGVVWIFWLGSAGLSLRAETPAAASPSLPPYQTLRFEQDWNFLSDSSRRSDLWDPPKFIPLHCRRLPVLSHAIDRCTIEWRRHAAARVNDMATTDEKDKDIPTEPIGRQSMTLGSAQGNFERRTGLWERSGFSRSLWAKDYRLWSPQPVAEIADRLGWLTLPEVMRKQAGEMTEFARQIRDEGFRHVVLLGMGGSSLAPEVFQHTLGNAPGCPSLTVLDSTHPDAVRATQNRVDLARTLFLVSSKSGTTIEPLSFLRYFWKLVGERSGAPGGQFAVITDPGTPLETMARERAFRRSFLATPDVGGRYSALTVFGLLPAALIGTDLDQLLDRAGAMKESCGPAVKTIQNPGLALGAALGELALAGYDKVTFLTSPGLQSFPAWAEQLIAESLGKNGKGIVPVADEPPGPPEAYGKDRVFVLLDLKGDPSGTQDSRVRALLSSGFPSIAIEVNQKADLAQEFFRWEIAIAAAGAVLGIHPFNQPDVELAKNLARQAMAKGTSGSGDASPTLSTANEAALAQAIREWMNEPQPGRYVAIQAYLAPAHETLDSLQELRRIVRDRTKLSTTLGFGPRFLHSTGQLHKGGPPTGLFLQLIDEPADDLPVPETGFTFGSLIRAQALGDYQALVERGRHVLRVNLGGDVARGLARLRTAFDSILPGSKHD